MTREAVSAALSARGIPAASVRTIAEVAECEQTRARNLLLRVRDSAQREWPIFSFPVRLETTPARGQSAIGPLGEANGWDG